MGDNSGWYYLGPDGQPAGPLTTEAVEGMLKLSTLDASSMVWREGLPEWMPWEKAASQDAASGPPAAAASAGDRAASVARKATVAAAPARPNPASAAPEDELESFMGEISALEAENAAEDDDGRKETPPPEDREFVDDDGTMYRWDSVLRAFKPVGEAPPELAYTEEDMMFSPEAERIPTLKQAKAAEAKGEEPLTGAKRQRAEAIEKEKEKIAKKAENAAEQAKSKDGWFELKKNTSVYVTGIPDDATVDEVKQEFTRCGLIKENEDRTPRIKLYKDKATGLLKGDGLVTFLKEPSVDLACSIMDGASLRPYGQAMKVTVAKFEAKTDFQPKKKPAKKQYKKKVLEKQEQDLGWDGFDDYKKAEKVTVVLKHMFRIAEMQADPSFEKELEEDVKAECSKLGDIQRVRVFATNPEGVITIRYKTVESAEACIKLMDGRFFGGAQIEAHMFDGHTNYHVKVQESEEEQRARLEAYAKEIEQGEA